MFETKITVRYAETDQMGVVYYANYFIYAERGRTELLRHAGLEYRKIEEDHQIYLPVKEAFFEYRAPAHYEHGTRSPCARSGCRSE